MTTEKELVKVRELLRKSLYQRGFHRLYKPVSKLGMGNYACVYVAERTRDNKQFAIKAFSKEPFQKGAGLGCLFNEVSIMRSLRHPNLPELEQVYESANSIYLVLSLLTGGQLHRELTPAAVRAVMAGLLAGLAELARLGIVHRDIKPDNVILADRACTKAVIVDFGLATRTAAKAAYARCGTPGYIAPEVLAPDSQVTPKNDMFSLGVVFHLLLTKRPLFACESSSRKEVYRKILELNQACAFDLARPLYAALSAEQKELLAHLLEKDPDCRWSAEQCLQSQYIRGGRARPAPEEEQRPALQ